MKTLQQVFNSAIRAFAKSRPNNNNKSMLGAYTQAGKKIAKRK